MLSAQQHVWPRSKRPVLQPFTRRIFLRIRLRLAFLCGTAFEDWSAEGCLRGFSGNNMTVKLLWVSGAGRVNPLYRSSPFLRPHPGEKIAFERVYRSKNRYYPAKREIANHHQQPKLFRGIIRQSHHSRIPITATTRPAKSRVTQEPVRHQSGVPSETSEYGGLWLGTFPPFSLWGTKPVIAFASLHCSRHCLRHTQSHRLL